MKDSFLLQGEDPLGAIRLRGCVVTSVESNPDGKNEFWGETGVSLWAPFPHLCTLSQQQPVPHSLPYSGMNEFTV